MEYITARAHPTPREKPKKYPIIAAEAKLIASSRGQLD